MRRKKDVKEALKRFVSFLKSSPWTKNRSVGLHSGKALEYKTLPNNLDEDRGRAKGGHQNKKILLRALHL